MTALNCDHVRIPTASSICWTGLACFRKFMNYGKECFGQPSIAHSKFYKDLQMYNNSSSIATSCILRLAANLVERECIIYLPTTLTIHTYYIQPSSAKSSQIPVHTLGPPISLRCKQVSRQLNLLLARHHSLWAHFKAVAQPSSKQPLQLPRFPDFAAGETSPSISTPSYGPFRTTASPGPRLRRPCLTAVKVEECPRGKEGEAEDAGA